jgi:hypothetical protein
MAVFSILLGWRFDPSTGELTRDRQPCDLLEEFIRNARLPVDAAGIR